jgi:hypothetical protein
VSAVTLSSCSVKVVTEKMIIVGRKTPMRDAREGRLPSSVNALRLFYSTPPSSTVATSTTTAEALVYMNLSKVIHRVPNPLGQNTFVPLKRTPAASTRRVQLQEPLRARLTRAQVDLAQVCSVMMDCNALGYKSSRRVVEADLKQVLHQNL